MFSNISFVWVLSNDVVAIIYCRERHHRIFQGVHSSKVAFCLTFRSFCLSLVVCTPMIYLNNVFLRNAIIRLFFNSSLNVLLISSICQQLLIIYLRFAKV